MPFNRKQVCILELGRLDRICLAEYRPISDKCHPLQKEEFYNKNIFTTRHLLSISMQKIKIQNNALASENMKPSLNNCALNEIYQKNFLYGLQNARNILSSLEHSIAMSSTYEDKLLRCKASHRHSHDFSDWPWDTEFCDNKDFKSSQAESDVNEPVQVQKPVSLQGAWSIMSIVCLQFQYEELSKHYEALLKAFNEKSNVISIKNSSLARLRQRARVMHARLASAHRTLLCIGEKYLAMKKRRHDQIQLYDKKIEFLKGRVVEVVKTAATARLHLDHKLSRSMAVERDSEYALLLAEMKKCNQLFLENLKLKAQLEEYLPGSVKWNT